MEVLLKKSKITGAVITQSLFSSIDNLIEPKILGWCNFKGVKFIIVYVEEKNIITKFPLRYTLRTRPVHEENPEGGKWIISVNYNYQMSVDYYYANEDEAKQAEIKINQGQSIAIQKGQFYI